MDVNEVMVQEGIKYMDEEDRYNITTTIGNGVWALYYYEAGPVATSVHKELVDAVKHQTSGELIVFWPYGSDLNDAIRNWLDQRMKKFSERSRQGE